MTHSHDFLPMTKHVSALVRRITMRLSGYLAFYNHKTITLEEGIAMFDLAEASRVLDRIAILPGMAQAEERARRDLLDLYSIFYPVDLEATQEQPACVHVIADGKRPKVDITDALAAGAEVHIHGPAGGGGRGGEGGNGWNIKAGDVVLAQQGPVFGRYDDKGHWVQS